MKQFKLSPLTLGVMLLAGTAVVSAAQGPYIGPTVGYYGFDSDREEGTTPGNVAPTDNNTDDGVFYGLSLGYQFTDNWALEFNYSRMPSESKVAGNGQAAGSDIDVDMYRLDGFYHLPLSKSLSPYVVLGYAYQDYDPEYADGQNDMGNFGVGAQYSFTNNIALRGDVRGFFDEDFVDYGVNVGLFYLFGATPPPPPEKEPEVDQCALDDDGDGVGNCDDSCPGTVTGESVDESGCAIVATKEPIRLDVKFASGKAFVSPEFFPKLQEVADRLGKNPNATVEIAGHTDNRGRESSNQKLSQRRADAVRDTLIAEFGIDGSRITAVGYGENDPIADNSTAEGRLENRRVTADID